ncbi:phage GP46 family protein, partial [Candidatus Glomeribacter gigasporarum]|uniref:phage GP46 family protein n=1 Tax=Candidatus Glomeribacter gigasporarum TaxID=132144 RepID=UPI0005B2E93E
SLFTDRQARPDDVIPDGSTDARGWWGKPNIGSRLWLLERAKATEATRQQARDYMTEALQWLIDDGAVARFEIDTGYSRSGRLDAQIIAYRQDGTTHAMRFEWAWPK